MTRSRCFMGAFMAFLFAFALALPPSSKGATIQEYLNGLVPGAGDYKEINLGAVPGVPEGARRTFLAYASGKPSGLIVRVESYGYNPDVPISALVGLDQRGTVTSVRVLNHGETPGWSDNLDKGTLQERFLFLPLRKALVLVQQLRAVRAGEVEAVTGATITSKGLARGVASARELFTLVMKPAE